MIGQPEKGCLTCALTSVGMAAQRHENGLIHDASRFQAASVC